MNLDTVDRRIEYPCYIFRRWKAASIVIKNSVDVIGAMEYSSYRYLLLPM
jgi:hypothetical protein